MREDILTARAEHLKKLRDANVSLYPTWNGRSHTALEVKENYEQLSKIDQNITVAGRLTATRKHGGSTFADVADFSGKIQILLRKNVLGGDAYELTNALDIGDIIAIEGKAIKTQAGEITIDAVSWTMLTKSLSPLPDKWYGLKDVEMRARQRELDLLINQESKEVFLQRSKVIRSIRDFLRDENFIEVETPILQPIAGGASARPFSTHHNALNMSLFLRIAPELYLKRLIVGGFEKVFEIGKSFRNEGVDRQHNPEFTSCEFYMAYATIDDLITFSEKLFVKIIRDTGKDLIIEYQGQKLNFTPPWPQINYVDAIKEKTGLDVSDKTALDKFAAFLKSKDIDIPEGAGVVTLVDTIFKEEVRKKIIQPVVVRDFPAYMEPLAKRCEGKPELVQRAQLIAMGSELFKAYTELNDPREQEERFMEQDKMRESGDTEAQNTDKQFLEALKIGLPPTAGWGMGIDRLTMLLTNQTHIRDVISFPLLKPEENA